MDCSLPGSSVHGIFQARVLEWDATAFSMDYYAALKTKEIVTCLNTINLEEVTLNKINQ